MRVLMVDDEASLRNAMRLCFTKAGYDFEGLPDGESALEYFRRETHPDLVILDVMMPGMDGFELCEALRLFEPDLPVIFLSAKSDIVDKRIGFQAGADDYIAKPFDEEELLLRVGAVLRRRGLSGSDRAKGRQELGNAEMRLRPGNAQAVVRGEEVRLTAKEFQILQLLMEHPDTAFTAQDIVDAVWGEGYSASTISIPAYVRHIRKKIERDPSDPQILQTVFGFGYRLHLE